MGPEEWSILNFPIIIIAVVTIRSKFHSSIGREEGENICWNLFQIIVSSFWAAEQLEGECQKCPKSPKKTIRRLSNHILCVFYNNDGNKVYRKRLKNTGRRRSGKSYLNNKFPTFTFPLVYHPSESGMNFIRENFAESQHPYDILRIFIVVIPINIPCEICFSSQRYISSFSILQQLEKFFIRKMKEKRKETKASTSIPILLVNISPS